MKKRVPSLILALALLCSLAAPALAADNGIVAAPGHELLSELPATLQRPQRPTTLEQAEGLTDTRRITCRLEQEDLEEFIEYYRKFDYTDEEIAEMVDAGEYAVWIPEPWTMERSKESVFAAIVMLTDSLTAGKTSDTEKAKAIYQWVADNIKYDYTAAQYYYIQATEKITKAQATRLHQAADPFFVFARYQNGEESMGICEGQALLALLMCDIAQIPSAYISGAMKDALHAWNAVLVDGKWVFFDATNRRWDMSPTLYQSSTGIFYTDGVFNLSNGWRENDSLYWLCPGYTCPEAVVVPEGVYQIMERQFMYCDTLKSITFPGTLREILTDAFSGCTGLNNVTIPAGVEYIGRRAFENCSSLTGFRFQGLPKKLMEEAFDGTPMVENAPEFALVDTVLVKYKGSDREVTIPQGVTAIGPRAFDGQLTLRKVVIPEGCVSIGDGAFNHCLILDDVTIPESVTTIGDDAFYKTLWLADLGDWAIFRDILLTYQGEDAAHLTVPDGVKVLAPGVFCGVDGLRSVTIPLSVKKIGAWMVSHTYLEDVYYAGTEAQWKAIDIDFYTNSNWQLDPDDEDTQTRFHFGTGFADVKMGEWYAEPVAWAMEKGITNGTSATTFSPGETCSRAQIITFLWRAAGSPVGNEIMPFSDVEGNTYYAEAVRWAASEGIVTGGIFEPDAPCTREMAVEFMWRLAGSPGAAKAGFADADSPAVDWAVEKGVTNGTNETAFSPEQTCTRAQIVTFLYRGFAG